MELYTPYYVINVNENKHRIIPYIIKLMICNKMKTVVTSGEGKRKSGLAMIILKTSGLPVNNSSLLESVFPI